MFLLGLPLMAVPMGAWAQDAPQLSEKVQKLAERDPAGGIMTLTAVLVVFLALLMLVLIFQFIGNLFQKRSAPKAIQPTAVKTTAPSVSGKPSDEALVAISLALQSATGRPDEVATAISLALRAELETQHDHESYVLMHASRRLGHGHTNTNIDILTLCRRKRISRKSSSLSLMHCMKS